MIKFAYIRILDKVKSLEIIIFLSSSFVEIMNNLLEDEDFMEIDLVSKANHSQVDVYNDYSENDDLDKIEWSKAIIIFIIYLIAIFVIIFFHVVFVFTVTNLINSKLQKQHSKNKIGGNKSKTKIKKNVINNYVP